MRTASNGYTMRLESNISTYRAVLKTIVLAFCTLTLVSCQGVTQKPVTKLQFSLDDFKSLQEAKKAYHGTDRPLQSKADTSLKRSRDESAKLPPVTSRWEFRAVRDLITELVKDTENVDHVKVCYAAQDNEWWITLYQDRVSVYDLKTYIWSVNHDRPEPYLALKKISKRNLERDLLTADSGCACKALEATKRGWVAWKPTAMLVAQSELPEETERAGERKPERSSKTSTPSKPRKRKVRRAVSAPPNPAQTRSASARMKPEAAPTRKPREDSEGEPYFRPAVAGPNPAEASVRELDQVRRRPAPRPSAARRPVSPRPLYRSGWERGLVNKEQERSQGPPKRASPGIRIEKPQHRLAIWSDTQVPDKKTREAPNRPDAESSTRAEANKPKPTVPTCYVFAYGAKMNHQDLLASLKAAGYDASLVLDASPAKLDGYDFVWNYYSKDRGGGAVNLEPKSNSSVYGLLIQIEDGLLPVWDHIEGHPVFYNRGDRRIPVKRLKDGLTVFAWVYLARPVSHARRDIWPTPAYKQEIVRAATFWGLPTRYLEKVKAWKTK